MVAFHRPQEVAAGLANLDGNLSLRVQSIANDDFIAQIHPAQQGWRRAHFTLPLFNSELG